MELARSSTDDIHIGISGWRYAPWRGRFYPKGLPQYHELAYAAGMLPSIELNGSFYSLQRPSAYRDWYAQTPEDFVFAVKGSRYITHMRRLKDVRVALANFLASGVLALGRKLGPFLWQLPPNLAFKPERIDEFLALLPRTGGEAVQLAREHDGRVDGRDWLEAPGDLRLRHAMEVRHDSFVDPEFIALLRRHNVAMVVADTAGRWPKIEDLTADFVYVRLHGDKKLYASGYGDEALDHWAERIRAWREGRQVQDARLASDREAGAGHREVYCYFDNDVKVDAPFDAARLARRLDVRTGFG